MDLRELRQRVRYFRSRVAEDKAEQATGALGVAMAGSHARLLNRYERELEAARSVGAGRRAPAREETGGHGGEEDESEEEESTAPSRKPSKPVVRKAKPKPDRRDDEEEVASADEEDEADLFEAAGVGEVLGATAGVQHMASLKRARKDRLKSQQDFGRRTLAALRGEPPRPQIPSAASIVAGWTASRDDGQEYRFDAASGRMVRR